MLKENIHKKTGDIYKVNLKMIKKMVKENIHLQMVIIEKGFLKMIMFLSGDVKITL